MMKKVLITGATSSQHSAQANDRSIKFSGLLKSSLEYSGVNVELRKVNLDESFDEYDKVLIGLAPFTSLSANNIYTALHTLEKVKNKAVVFLDNPDPSTVFTSFNSVVKNKNIMSKDLYAKRNNYHQVTSNKKFFNSVLEGINLILCGKIPIVIPTVPYFKYSTEILKINTDSLIPINFDSYFADDYFYEEREYSKYWLTDTRTSEWIKTIQNTIYNPVINYKRNNYDYDLDLINRILNSYGYLKTTHKYNIPWWSRFIMLTLSAGVPVVSDWRQTQIMGKSWDLLPHTIESMTHKERKLLAEEQKISYLSMCPTWKESSSTLITLINI